MTVFENMQSDKKIFFQKNYTRDTSLTIQQIWFEVLEHGLKNNFNIAMPKIIIGVDFINNGAVEVWENVKYIKQIKNKIIKLAKNQPQKTINFLIQYETKLKELQPIWKKGCATKKEEMLWLIEQIRQKMFGDVVLTYLAEDKRTPTKIKTIAKKLRAHDQFFATNDIVLRNSLKRLFPTLKPFTHYIKIEEVAGTLPTRAELQTRYSLYISTSDGYCKLETLVNFARCHPNYIFKEQKIKLTGQRIIKGQTAYKGIARGIVRIVRNVSQINKVKTGDILVMPMTTAQFILAIRRAAGIITEEGGALCHAAVIAREFKKPCVIGTKIATKVLKDGDLVEVDANQGIVKIVKHA